MIFQNLEFHNVEEMVYEEEKKGYLLYRVPTETVHKINDFGQTAAWFGAGTEIRFHMISDEVTLILSRKEVPANVISTGVLEVFEGDYQGRYEISPRCITTEPTRITIRKMKHEGLPIFSRTRESIYSDDLVRVLLPYDWGNYFYGVEGEVLPPDKKKAPQRSYLAYGSSITHGGGASVPSASYPRVIANHLGMELYNLGFAGSAQCDPCIADFIVNQKKLDLITLELGVNVTSWGIEDFYKRAYEFVEKIVAANTKVPILCIDIFRNHNDLSNPALNQSFREAVKKIVQEINQPNVIYFNGMDLLTDYRYLSSDGLHPSNEGLYQIATNIVNQYKEKLGLI